MLSIVKDVSRGRTLLDDVLSDWTTWTMPQASSIGAYNVEHTDSGIRYEIDVPGIKAQDLDVTADDGIIIVRGKRKNRDVSYRFNVSDRFDLDGATSELVDGVLTITVPFVPKREPKKIKLLTR